MEKLNKKWMTLICVSLTAMLGVFLVGAILAKPVSNLQVKINRSMKNLVDGLTILSRKTALDTQWQTKKDYFSPGVEQDVILNAWVQQLPELAQSQGLTLEKLEPAGTREGREGKSLTVFISFQGDIRQFAQFAYRLSEKDPLSRIESFDVRWQEESRNFSFEILLGKVIR